jgi:hypothetical protein
MSKRSLLVVVVSLVTAAQLGASVGCAGGQRTATLGGPTFNVPAREPKLGEIEPTAYDHARQVPEAMNADTSVRRAHARPMPGCE